MPSQCQTARKYQVGAWAPPKCRCKDLPSPEVAAPLWRAHPIRSWLLFVSVACTSSQLRVDQEEGGYRETVLFLIILDTGPPELSIYLLWQSVSCNGAEVECFSWTPQSILVHLQGVHNHVTYYITYYITYRTNAQFDSLNRHSHTEVPIVTQAQLISDTVSS